MSLNQYSFNFRLTLSMPLYLLPLNDSVDKWMHIINSTISPKKNVVNIITIPQGSAFMQQIRETLINLKLNKFVARTMSLANKSINITNNTVIDLEFAKYFAERRNKSAVKQQIKILQNIIADVVDVTKQKALVIAFNQFDKVPDRILIKPYSQTILYGLYKYGNAIFDLFDVVVILYYVNETKPKYFIVKSEFKQEIDLNKVNTFFRKLYSQYLVNNEVISEDDLISNQMLEDVEKEISKDKKEMKITLKNIKMFKAVDVDRNAINVKTSDDVFTKNYEYDYVNLNKPLQKVIKEKIPKPIHRNLDHELLPNVLSKIIELKGFKVLNVEIVSNKIINSTKDTITKKYVFDIELPNGTKDRLEVEIPALIDQYYYYIGGTKKILLQQIINKPIIYIGNHTTLILTHRQTMRVQYKKTKSGDKTFEWYVVGLRINPIIPFTIHNRLESFANAFGFDVKIE